MPVPAGFHDVLFPLSVARDSSGGPERRTDIVTLGSGAEERNARWAHARRRYDAGLGVRSLNDVRQVINFFEARRGRLYAFRFRDMLDCSSHALSAAPTADDVTLGTGNGSAVGFQLIKTYGAGDALYTRPVTKPVAGTVLLKVAGAVKTIGTHADLDALTGIVTFRPGHVPAAGAVVSAGFYFDVPVRFDNDRLSVNLKAFQAGDIASIPLVEVRV